MQFDQWIKLKWEDLQEMAEAARKDRPKPPRPFWDEQVIIVCHDLKEFLDPMVFGADPNPYGLGEKSFGPMFAVGMLLAPSPCSSNDDPSVFGRWAGCRITIPTFASEIKWPGAVYGKQNLAQYAWEHYTEISYEMVAFIAASNEFEDRPWPRSFRAILRQFIPITKDVTWLRPQDLAPVVLEARSRGINFFNRFIRWLRRQELTEETRRELGGRPGRIEHFRQLREEREGKRRRPRGVRIRKRT